MAKEKKQTEVLFRINKINPQTYSGCFTTISGKLVTITIYVNKKTNQNKKHKGPIALLTLTEDIAGGSTIPRVLFFEDLGKAKIHIEKAYNTIKAKFEGIEDYQKRQEKEKKANKKKGDLKEAESIKEIIEEEKKAKTKPPVWKEMNKAQVADWLRNNTRINFDPSEKKTALVKLAKDYLKKNEKK